MSIKTNYESVLSTIEKNAALAGVPASSIHLVCVSKTQPVSAILEAYDAGARSFGENRVQEFVEKYAALSKKSDIFWNLIGQLQTNKVKYITSEVGLLHSLDREALAIALHKQLSARGETMNCLIQVNVSKEASKAGVYEEDVMPLIEAVSKLDTINIRGIMTIAPFAENPESVRVYFAKAKRLFDSLASLKSERFSMDWLSMGMSGDYEVAIQEGANMVRVGSAIFGSRG